MKTAIKAVTGTTLIALLLAGCGDTARTAPDVRRESIGITRSPIPEDGQWTMAAKASWK